MAEHINWNNTKEKNWFRGAKGLLFLHDGLEGFVGTAVHNHRDQALQTVLIKLPGNSPDHCNQCTLENLLPGHACLANKPCNKRTCVQRNIGCCLGHKQPNNRRQCPNGICSQLYDIIVDDHQFQDPLWKNTDPSTWCSDPVGWSFGAKCFQTTPNDGTSAADTDAAGLLSIVINNKTFQNMIACNLNTQSNVFYWARDIRNDILHSPKMELEDAQLQSYIDIFINVLKDTKCLLNDPKAQQAVEKLKQLRNNQIEINSSDVVYLIKMKKDALAALERLQEKEAEAVNHIEAKQNETLKAIDDAATDAKSETLVAIEDNTLAGLERLNDKEVEATTNIRLTENEALVKIGDASRNAIQRIESTKMQEDVDQLTAGILNIRTVSDDDCPSPTKKRHIEEESETLTTRLQHIREDLVSFYRSEHVDMTLAPLIEDSISLHELYVMPDIVRTREVRTKGNIKEVKEPVKSLRNVFFNTENKLYGSSYMCADAGLGKTAFSKRLTLAWCQSKNHLTSDNTYFPPEEVEAVEEFNFVFLLLLRESHCNQCKVDEMIRKQIISHLTRRSKIQRGDIEHILFNEKCLVIIDGLDEWSHPSSSTCSLKDSSIPHWNKRETLAVLTTTRPWKFSVARLKTGQIDQKLELTRLSHTSAYRLKVSFLGYCKRQKLGVQCLSTEEEKNLKEEVDKFTEEVKKKNISNLKELPLFLLYLLLLWHNGLELGENVCQLYSYIIELLLSRAFKQEIPGLATREFENTHPCFSKLKHCQYFSTHLKALGRLAFETLFRANRHEHTLVFDSTVAEKYLGKDSFELGLKTGLISKNKNIQVNPLQPSSRVSYAHKTMQEFFAALYTCYDSNIEEMTDNILSNCKGVKDVLNISKILTFISGMNTNLAERISYKTMELINNDEITYVYRNSTKIRTYETPLKHVQDMLVSCFREIPPESEVHLCFQDVFIDKSCKSDQYRKNLKRLIMTNKQNIKALHIVMLSKTDEQFERFNDIVNYFAIDRLENIIKIYCTGVYIDDSVIPLLNTHIRCLSLSFGTQNSLPHLLCESVTKLNELEAIRMKGLVLSHNELRELYLYISRNVHLRHIELWKLRCNEHRTSCSDDERSDANEIDIDIGEEDECPDLSLDVSAHKQLRELNLWYIGVSELCINIAPLEVCQLQHVPLKGHVFHHPPGEQIGNQHNTSKIMLHDVRLSSSVLDDLLKVVEALSKQVQIRIENCDVEPASEWDRLKEYVRTHQWFDMMVDRKDRFQFESISH